jgi:hypothetical protein
LPSSLTRVFPITLVYSTHLPESVCGTGASVSVEDFLGSLGSVALGLPHAVTPQLRGRICLPPSTPKRLAPTMSNGWAHLPSCVSPSLITTFRGTGILTCCPSPTLLSLGLGPTNPTRINLPSETLGLRCPCFSQGLRYSYRHSHFCPLHRSSRSCFSA